MTTRRNRAERNKAEIEAEIAKAEALGMRPPLATQMQVELVVNDSSNIWVLHDKPFPAILQWAEYDRDENNLIFVTDDGLMQDLGMVIPEAVADVILECDQLCAMYMNDGKVSDMGMIPIMVRDSVFH